MNYPFRKIYSKNNKRTLEGKTYLTSDLSIYIFLFPFTIISIN